MCSKESTSAHEELPVTTPCYQRVAVGRVQGAERLPSSHQGNVSSRRVFSELKSQWKVGRCAALWRSLYVNGSPSLDGMEALCLDSHIKNRG